MKLEPDMIQYLKRLITEEECGNCPIDIGHPDCVGKDRNKVMLCRHALDWLENQENITEQTINVWLDDLRPTPEGFIGITDATVCMQAILHNKVNILSLDHDLGDGKETGYDLTKSLVGFGLEYPEIWPKTIYLHTANPIGRENMYQLLMRYKPEWVKVHKSPMPNND